MCTCVHIGVIYSLFKRVNSIYFFKIVVYFSTKTIGKSEVFGPD